MTTFDNLKRDFSEGRVDRRDFIRQATAMGMAAAIPAGIVAQEARATEPKRGGLFRSAVRGGATSDSIDGAALLDTHNIMTSWTCRNNLTEVARMEALSGNSQKAGKPRRMPPPGSSLCATASNFTTASPSMRTM